ncbi:MAG: alpha-1,2-fucosyltransferase [Chromatiaceae bacterium]|nr:alpha-1,2-fucosyltransferase [Chromatiaceae bacterium]
MDRKIIVRIKGGIGNQLFCYAAARRLALVSQVELILDDVTGFVRDHRYRRAYALDHFAIPCRKATPRERMEPFERGRRALAKWLARRRPLAERRYIEQQGNGFDESLLTLVPHGTVYLDGLWQDERHFADVAGTVRTDLAFRRTPSDRDRELARRMDGCQSVALHVRWFDSPTTPSPDHNLGAEYYQQAVQEIERRIPWPHYFLFSDDVAAAARKLEIPRDRVTLVDHNEGDDGAILDLWLMSCCQHFILANSTFSWWGAWLSAHRDGIRLMPGGIPGLRRASVWRGRAGWAPETP